MSDRIIDPPNCVTYLLIEHSSLIHLPRETVNQETATSFSPTFTITSFAKSLLHCILQQLDCNLHRHNLALFDISTDHVAVGGTGTILFCTEKVASCRVK